MIATGLAIVILAGVIIGVQWNKHAILQGKYDALLRDFDKLHRLHTDLLLSRRSQRGGEED